MGSSVRALEACICVGETSQISHVEAGLGSADSYTGNDSSV